jgi:hypothetical protein
MATHEHIIKNALILLDTTLSCDGEGRDANLLTAIRILEQSSITVDKTTFSRFGNEETKKILRDFWNHVAAEIKAHAQPVDFDQETLFVHVDQQGFLDDFVANRRKELLSALQKRFRAQIRSVYFTLGPIQDFLTFFISVPPDLLPYATRDLDPHVYRPNQQVSPQWCIHRAIQQSLKDQSCKILLRSEAATRSNAPEPENSDPLGALDNFWKLVKHWELKAESNQITDEERQVFLKCANQLRQRTEWAREMLENTKVT